MRRILLPALLGALGTTANASAWIEPNDLALRHDIQLLSDYGLLPIPTSSWPRAPIGGMHPTLRNAES